jgi:uncharacterized protein
MTGTLLNVGTVLVGTTLGTLLGDRLPERVRGIALQAIGLFTLLIGIQMALQVQNPLVLLGSLALGGVVGEFATIEQRLDLVGQRLEGRFGAADGGPDELGSRFVRGFVTSSLVFCVGPLTIVGAIQDGLTGNYSLLSVKSLLDGLTSIALSSALGRGVYFSAVVILVYQGGLTLAASVLGAVLGDPSHDPGVLEMTAAGGLLIVGLGLRLLNVATVRVGNLLPALALAPLLTWLAEHVSAG